MNVLNFLKSLLDFFFKKQPEKIVELPKQEVKIIPPKIISAIPIYKQSNPKWGHLTIGKTKMTMAKDGCYITSLAMIDGRLPSIILELFNQKNAFNSEGMLLNDVAAKLLGRKYSYSKTNPNKVCICETNHFAPSYPQHFFVWLNDKNSITDPLDGKIKNNFYKIVSYRIFDKIA